MRRCIRRAITRIAACGLAVFLASLGPAHAGELPPEMDLAGPVPLRVVKVIDGDTIDARVAPWPGLVVIERIRLVPLDTPEIRGAQCPAERAAGERAKARLAEILAAAKLVTAANVQRRRDSYGRLLAEIYADGRSVSDQLISEDLAVIWQPRSQRPVNPWCG